MKKTKLIGLVIIGLISSFGTKLIAQDIAAYTQPYKSTVSGKTSIYIPTNSPGQPIASFSSPSIPKTKALTLNNCGIGKVSKGTTSPITNIEGSGLIDFNSRQMMGTKPTCTLNKTSGQYESSWNPSVGAMMDDGTSIYIKGGTGAGAITISVTNDSKISTKANACGTVRVNVSDTKPMANFAINGSTFYLADLPERLPEQCKASIKYLPFGSSDGSQSNSSGG